MENKEDQTITPNDLSKIFLRRVKDDKDVALGISGYEGDGKSVLGVQVVIEVLRQQGKTDDEIIINFDDYMIYSPDKKEIFEKVTKPEKYAPIDSDEAVKALYKLNWASTGQKFLNMLFQLCRKENKINILCIPRFTDLNEYFRNHRIMFWIHILERGTAVLMIRDWSPFSKDPWHIDENRKVIDNSRRRKKLGDFELEEKLNLMKKARGFVAVVKWDDLTTRFKNAYLKGKEKYSYKGMEEVMEGQGTTQSMLKEVRVNAAVTLRTKGVHPKTIADILNVDVRTVYDYLRNSENEDLSTINNNHPKEDNFD